MPVRGNVCTFMALCVTFLIPLSYPFVTSCKQLFSLPPPLRCRCAHQPKSRSLIFADPRWRRVSKPRTTLMRQPEYTNSYPASRGVFGCVPISGELQPRRARQPPTHPHDDAGRSHWVAAICRVSPCNGFPRVSPRKNGRRHLCNYFGRGAAPTPLAYIALSI